MNPKKIEMKEKRSYLESEQSLLQRILDGEDEIFKLLHELEVESAGDIIPSLILGQIVLQKKIAVDMLNDLKKLNRS